MRILILLAALIGPLAMTSLAADCVPLRHEGKSYALVYSGDKCSDREPLPESLYPALASWAFNASHAGTISQLDRFRILARLATQDPGETHGFGRGPDLIGPWSDNAWAHHADQAYLGLKSRRSPDGVMSVLLTRYAARPPFATR